MTSQLHQSVGLDPLGRRLIRRLDGAHQRSDLIACVAEAIEAGEVKITPAKGPAKPASEKTLAMILDQMLGGLSESALLIG